MDQVAVGRRISAARKRAGIGTRKELAERVGIPRLGKETLGKIERGERPLYEHEAPYVARALEVPVRYFFEDDDSDTLQDQLAQIQERLAEAETEREEMRRLIDEQNANLARQSEILERIEALVAVIPSADEVQELRRAIDGAA